MFNDTTSSNSIQFANQNASQYQQSGCNCSMQRNGADLFANLDIKNPQLFDQILNKIGVKPSEQTSPQNQPKMATLQKMMQGQGMENNGIITDDELNRVQDWIDKPLQAPDALAGFADALNGYAQEADLAMDDQIIDSHQDTAADFSEPVEANLKQDKSNQSNSTMTGVKEAPTGSGSAGNPYFGDGGPTLPASVDPTRVTGSNNYFGDGGPTLPASVDPTRVTGPNNYFGDGGPTLPASVDPTRVTGSNNYFGDGGPTLPASVDPTRITGTNPYFKTSGTSSSGSPGNGANNVNTDSSNTGTNSFFKGGVTSGSNSAANNANTDSSNTGTNSFFKGGVTSGSNSAVNNANTDSSNTGTNRFFKGGVTSGGSSTNSTPNSSVGGSNPYFGDGGPTLPASVDPTRVTGPNNYFGDGGPTLPASVDPTRVTGPNNYFGDGGPTLPASVDPTRVSGVNPYFKP